MPIRPLHFIWIIDCSSAMSIDGRIESLNYAIDAAIPSMQTVAEENPHAQVLMRALKFSTGAQWHIPQPTPLVEFKWKNLSAGGKSDMGKALRMLAEQIEIDKLGERGLPPVLVLVSGSQPTDDFHGSLEYLMSKPWAEKAARIAIAVGKDADSEVLQSFIGHNEIQPLQAHNADQLTNYIKWVSTSVRLKSANISTHQKTAKDSAEKKEMDNFVRQTLQKIIQQYGTTVCDEPKRCENLLKDLCPQHKREVHVLITALHAQVAADLLKIPAGVPVKAVLIRLVQRLHDERAMQMEAAKWAVGTWAVALGVVESIPTAVPVQTPTPKASQPKPQPVQLAQPKLPSVEYIHGWPATRVQDLQQQTADALKLPIVFQDRLRDGSIGPEMVVIPAGEYLMGLPTGEGGRYDNEAQHRVRLSRPFGMGKYAVTFAEYDRFAGATGRDKPSDAGWGRGNRPVINVSWHDAVAYADWLSGQTGATYRLPTEAEWEYACRAGTTDAFWWGDDIHTGQANYNGSLTYRSGRKGEYRQRTVAVNEFVANPWGLYQMHGNVWEWCEDVYIESIAQSVTQIDPIYTTGGSNRVLRGGSWRSDPCRLRAARRYNHDLADRDSSHGFRLARTATF